MMSHPKLLSPLLRLLLCCLGAGLPWSVQAAELTVSAAASLNQAFQALAPQFEAAHPGHKLRLNFGASGALLQQIAKGAPVDVFASADAQTMDQAQSQGLVKAEDRRDFASNTLVLVVSAASRAVPTALPDLLQPRFGRLAIGQPAIVPAGRYAQAALESQGLWTRLAPRVIGAQNVRQALDYVARGEVDAAFVYASDAALMPAKVTVAFAVATPSPIVYPAAALASSPNLALARRYVEFLGTPQAQVVLAAQGFGKP